METKKKKIVIYMISYKEIIEIILSEKNIKRCAFQLMNRYVDTKYWHY